MKRYKCNLSIVPTLMNVYVVLGTDHGKVLITLY